MEELQDGAVHWNARIRLAAIDTLCRGGEPNMIVENGALSPKVDGDIAKHSLPHPSEIALIKEALPLCMHGSSSAERHDLKISVRSLLMRCKDAAAAADKEAENLQGLWRTSDQMWRKCLDGAGDADDASPEKSTASVVRDMRLRAKRTMQEAVKLSMSTGAIARWLFRMLLRNLYEGSPFLREIMSLELLHLACEVLGHMSTLVDGASLSDFPSDASSNTGVREASSKWRLPVGDDDFAHREAPAIAVLWCEECARTLFRLLGSTWDRTRLLAMEILIMPRAFPKPLPGFSTPEKIRALVGESLAQATTPRSNTTEAGARVLTFLWHVYASALGWTIRIDPQTEAVEVAQPEAVEASQPADNSSPEQRTSSSGHRMLRDVIQLASQRVGTMTSIFRNDLSSRRGGALAKCLAHGLLTFLKCTCEMVDLGGKRRRKRMCLAQKVEKRADWAPILEGIFDQVKQAFDAALLVIAEEQVVGKDWSAADVAGDGADRYSTSAPVQMNLGSKVSVRVDCRGHAVVDTVSQHEQQMIIVGSWLLVRETAKLIVVLMDLMPMPPSTKVDSSGAGGIEDLVPHARIAEIGDMLVDALARIKHQGAIAATTNALQATAEVMMSCGRYDIELCTRPKRWLAGRVFWHLQSRR